MCSSAYMHAKRARRKKQPGGCFFRRPQQRQSHRLCVRAKCVRLIGRNLLSYSLCVRAKCVPLLGCTRSVHGEKNSPEGVFFVVLSKDNPAVSATYFRPSGRRSRSRCDGSEASGTPSRTVKILLCLCVYKPTVSATYFRPSGRRSRSRCDGSEASGTPSRTENYYYCLCVYKPAITEPNTKNILLRSVPNTNLSKIKLNNILPNTKTQQHFQLNNIRSMCVQATAYSRAKCIPFIQHQFRACKMHASKSKGSYIVRSAFRRVHHIFFSRDESSPRINHFLSFSSSS